MKDLMIALGFVFLLLVRLVIRYVLVPLLLVVILGAFGVTISFLMAMGICFLFYFILMLIKNT